VAGLAERFAQDVWPSGNQAVALEDTQREALCVGAYWAGLLHDLGKYRPEFQKMIRGEQPRNEQTRHKLAGAAQATKPKPGRLDIALAIAGHHGGLPDLSELPGLVKEPNWLAVAERVWTVATRDCHALNQPIPSWALRRDQKLLFDFHVRLLFSCLVDADWRDTSEFHRQNEQRDPDPEPDALDPAKRLEHVLAYIRTRARSCRDPRIALIRQDILNAALQAAEEPSGLFAMTVPTGGGKTLSALAFALAHARRHGLRRVIYVAPYLSIIEQNAREIRRALQADDGANLVFEHHSLAEPTGPSEDDQRSDEAMRRAENWDAPVVVTTSVQFYESFFSNRPGPCRKLHNVARSVVILDECQTLPPDLVAPTCSMLEQWATLGGCSIVLCTATQPAWNRRAGFDTGLSGIRDIVPASLDLFAKLRRVRLEWSASRETSLDWGDVAQRMMEQRAVLTIVNTKRAARELFGRLREIGCDDALHLSTAMCPAHRLEVLDDVRRRLEAGEYCRLVSTQLIEAGVDVDFPMVFRELAPLEAIIQSAGRCNREGLLNSPDGQPGGRVIVFRSREGALPNDRWYRAGITTLEQAFLGTGREPDIGLPEHIQEYFRRLYRTGELDARQIQALRMQCAFKTVCQGDEDRRDVGRYQLIDELTTPVVAATWQSHREEIEELRIKLGRSLSRRLLRKLSAFQVNLPLHEAMQAGAPLREETNGLKLWMGDYEEKLGVLPRGEDGALVV